MTQDAVIFEILFWTQLKLKIIHEDTLLHRFWICFHNSTINVTNLISNVKCETFTLSFPQEMFTCVRSDESSIDCADSPRYYELNRSFGDVLEADQTMEEQPSQEAQMATSASDGLQVIEDLLEDRANRRSSKY